MEPQAEKLTRPHVETLDEILGQSFPVLDDGFVRVVDYMGDDAAVVQAARVSYGAGTKKVSDDRGLIRYLLRHRHTTPFEMCSLKLHVRVPMDAWRQWIRHRTACLAEGTEIYFDLPSGVQRRGNQLYKIKIEDLWQRFQPTCNTQRPDKQRDPYFRRDRVKRMKLRHLNEETGRITHTRIIDVFRNGPKPVFRYHLADGKSIEATADHRFLFLDGWSTFGVEMGLREQNGKAVWNDVPTFLHVNGMVAEAPALYQDREWLDEQYNKRGVKIQDIADACGVSYHTVRKWIREHGIQHDRGGRSKDPWNKGKKYRNGPREVTEEWLAANRKARGGPASNFWKGGVTTLCVSCHKNVHMDELAYVERLGGTPVKTAWVKRPRIAWNKLKFPRLVEVVDIEYVGIKETYDLEVAGPSHNFIANGIVTHNSVNETSTRYSVAIDAAQRTAPDQWRIQAVNNKQGSDGQIDPDLGANLTAEEADLQDRIRTVYNDRLEKGVAREQARKDLPLCTYTEAYWKMDLHNLLHFLALRMDSHAQKEIRDYATVIGRQIVARWVPLVWEAFEDYRFGATHFSRLETDVLAAIGSGDMDHAMAMAREIGWLKESKKGGWLRHRERQEFEEKLQALNMRPPWLD